METEFIYWAHPTPVGIRVEEVSGMETKSGKVWIEMAKQIFAENGHDTYREIGHFSNGAPFILGAPVRISVTHTSHLLAVAMLPKTPEANLQEFNRRTALGIDAESWERRQVINVRSKFLSERELEMIPEDDIKKNVIAWTAKEALYKAGMTEGLDFSQDIQIHSLPEPDMQMNMPGAPAIVTGKATIVLPSGPEDMELYCYDSEGYCVTLAYSPKCAKYSTRR